MTKLQEFIEQVRERIEKATPGPWKQVGETVVKEPYRTIHFYGSTSRRSPRGDFPHGGISDDADFVAHSRLDLDRAIQIIEKQRAALQQIIKINEPTAGNNTEIEGIIAVEILADCEKILEKA